MRKIYATVLARRIRQLHSGRPLRYRALALALTAGGTIRLCERSRESPNAVVRIGKNSGDTLSDRCQQPRPCRHGLGEFVCQRGQNATASISELREVSTAPASLAEEYVDVSVDFGSDGFENVECC